MQKKNKSLIYQFRLNQYTGYCENKQLCIKSLKHISITLLYIFSTLYIFLNIRNLSNNDTLKTKKICVNDLLWITSVFSSFCKSYLVLNHLKHRSANKDKKNNNVKNCLLYKNNIKNTHINQIIKSLEKIKTTKQRIEFESDMINMFLLTHVVYSLLYLFIESNNIKQNIIHYELSLSALLLFDLTFQFNNSKSIINDSFLDLKNEKNHNELLFNKIIYKKNTPRNC